MPAEESIRILIGAEAVAAFDDAEFRRQWSELYFRCPWATVGQHPEFVRVHWSLYSDRIQPVLVYRLADDGVLTGVLPLGRDGSALAGAGGDDCEYHVWLEVPEWSNSFMPAALRALRELLGPVSLKLDYLPPGTPLEWVRLDRDLAAFCDLVTHQRRVLRVRRADEIDFLLASKTTLNRRYKKLRSLGRVDVRRITVLQDFDGVLESFVPQFDFRQGSTHRVTAFQSNPSRRELLRSLFTHDLLLVVTLELDGKVLAAHVGINGKDGVFSFGGISHDEFRAWYSPGLLLQMELMRLLVADGYEQFDMTPGEDVYKSHLGNEIQDAYALTVLPTRTARVKRVMRRRVRGHLKMAREVLPARGLGLLTPRTVSSGAAGNERGSRLAPLRCFDVNDAMRTPASGAWRRNDIAEVLKFTADGDAYWTFLSRVRKHILAGATIMTRADIQGIVAAFVYSVNPAELPATAPEQELAKPNGRRPMALPSEALVLTEILVHDGPKAGPPIDAPAGTASMRLALALEIGIELGASHSKPLWIADSAGKIQAHAGLPALVPTGLSARVSTTGQLMRASLPPDPDPRRKPSMRGAVLARVRMLLPPWMNGSQAECGVFGLLETAAAVL